MRIKSMFISDLDGTLFRSDKQFSEKDLESLELIGNKGITRVLATGRSVFSLKRSITTPLPFDYLIFSTGMGVSIYSESFENIMKTTPLTAEDTRDIASFLSNLSLDFMIHDPLPDNHVFSFSRSSGTHSDFLTRISFYKNHCREINTETCVNTESSQILVMVSAEKGNDLFPVLKKRFERFSVIKTTSPFDGKTLWIEIFPKNVSKGNAVRWLAEKQGIQPENMAAIGNDFNDEDLLETVGKAYVVENAPEELKERFTVVSSNDHGGVSQAIHDALVRGVVG